MNYYNEFDKAAAAWLRELIKQGLIPNGDVDERSIKDVTANDLRPYTQCHFFAGIGGWSYALQLAGWPEDKPCWTGSCPCQPYSSAGLGKGNDDERDLWPVFGKLIKECKPEFVFGEQVENAIRHGWLDRVYADLEVEGYTIGAVVLGAHSVNAPHQRQRLYWGGMLSMVDSTGGRERRKSTDFCEKDGRPDGKMLREFIGANNNVSIPHANSERRNGQSIPDVREHEVPETLRDGSNDGLADTKSLGRGTRRPESERNSTMFSCDDGGISNPKHARLERCGGFKKLGDKSGWEGKNGQIAIPCLYGLSPWSDFRFIYCRDGKIRRIPAESLFFSVADGVSEGVDGGGIIGISEDGGFPLTTKKEGRAMMLKGYGNAIVPELAAEFIIAFTEEIK